MRVSFALFIATILLTQCVCRVPKYSSNRKYIADKGFRHQIDRFEELLDFGIFSTRNHLSLEAICDFIDLIMSILDALEPLLPDSNSDSSSLDASGSYSGSDTTLAPETTPC